MNSSNTGSLFSTLELRIQGCKHSDLILRRPRRPVGLRVSRLALGGRTRWPEDHCAAWLEWLVNWSSAEKDEYDATEKELEGICKPIMIEVFGQGGGEGGITAGMQRDAPADREASARGVEITGRVVARRLLGKRLAFATLAVELADGHSPGSAVASASVVSVEELKLCFAADTWDASSEAPFPARRSLLQVGSRVTVETQTQFATENTGEPDREAATVVRWTIHEQGGGRAAGRISTVGISTAAPSADLNTHNGCWHSAAGPRSVSPNMQLTSSRSRCRMRWQRSHLVLQKTW